jgi:hypothetical protein
MINGNEYAWEDIQVVLPGKTIPNDGVAGIEYTVKKDHTNVYARGDKPIKMGRGKKEYSGMMTLLQSCVEEMQAGLAPGKDLTDIAAFPIIVGYAPEGGIATVDRLLYTRISEYKKGMKTGDGHATVDCTLVIGDIKYNM